MDLSEAALSDWEMVLELDEALAGWVHQGPARGEWGWEWGWAASDLQDPDWDTEDLPAVSDASPDGKGPRDTRWGTERWKVVFAEK